MTSINDTAAAVGKRTRYRRFDNHTLIITSRCNKLEPLSHYAAGCQHGSLGAPADDVIRHRVQ